MDYAFSFISVAGTFAFAISGALTAMHKRFDQFGIFIIAFVTAVGGGTIRDILVSNSSVFWLVQPSYVYYILAGTVVAIIFRKNLLKFHRVLLLFDTLGLAFYTVIGVQIGLQNSISAIGCIVLGSVTGAFGGVARDILVNDVPVIFHKEIYATISILGGAVYFLLDALGLDILYTQIIAITMIVVLRFIVIQYSIALPSIYSNDEMTKD